MWVYDLHKMIIQIMLPNLDLMNLGMRFINVKKIMIGVYYLCNIIYFNNFIIFMFFFHHIFLLNILSNFALIYLFFLKYFDFFSIKLFITYYKICIDVYMIFNKFRNISY